MKPSVSVCVLSQNTGLLRTSRKFRGPAEQTSPSRVLPPGHGGDHRGPLEPGHTTLCVCVCVRLRCFVCVCTDQPMTHMWVFFNRRGDKHQHRWWGSGWVYPWRDNTHTHTHTHLHHRYSHTLVSRLSRLLTCCNPPSHTQTQTILTAYITCQNMTERTDRRQRTSAEMFKKSRFCRK